ncbi:MULTISPECIES: PTS glucose transporter subunit IIA [Lactobacillus]|uniref:PTS glucose transporter subunit IIA n=1 Tax=Lactobacillus xujianguonis TaxID=2495899 RepID=A0A437SWP6_9LACO|nr:MULTISPECIES: PTS glucose transporter subunit IIA [Lactobacillus]RVU71334.1 PTS glucose transporter subunit IIA [Lactobacillus xujianguonis]RVU74037.1 PTS glucose transporter subunit IIA [Lactobacillus xujianguonis]
MFNFFKKHKKEEELNVQAVVDGNVMPITAVKDDVFSTKMLGDGFAIKPSNGQIFAPVAGEISTLFPTKHAIGIKTNEGLEVLIHLGLDTVELKGMPFSVLIEQGDQVKAGQQLGTMDLKKISDQGYDDTCIVVYTNMDLLKSVSPIEGQAVQHGQVVQSIQFQ